MNKYPKNKKYSFQDNQCQKKSLKKLKSKFKKDKNKNKMYLMLEGINIFSNIEVESHQLIGPSGQVEVYHFRLSVQGSQRDYIVGISTNNHVYDFKGRIDLRRDKKWKALCKTMDS